MELPRIKMRLPKYQSETLQMGGYNASDKIQPGDILDSYGISARRWPYISTRWAREQELPPGDTTAIFAWDGHKVRVTGGLLYYDDTAIDNVTPGEKQFAVVNTKLIVWPDKLYIDVTNGKFGHLDATVTLSKAVIASDRVSGVKTGIVRHDVQVFSIGGGGGKINPGCYTYGKSPARIKWGDGGWSLPTPTRRNFYGYTGSAYSSPISVGDILIPSKYGNAYRAVTSPDIDYDNPDISGYNNEGQYAVVTRIDLTGGGPDIEFALYADIYDVASKRPTPISETFEELGAVNITGTIGGYNDKDKVLIKSVDPATNAIVFGKDTFRPCDLYGQISVGAGVEDAAIEESASVYWAFTVSKRLRAGLYIFKNGEKITVWDGVKKAIVEETTCQKTSTFEGTIIRGTVYDGDPNVTISRPIPDMDFICESQNRLWGCSNKDRTIYASSLGLPAQFYDYEGGLATNSYAVAVGSEGDFTACAPYRNSVVFFKEDKIHRVSGAFPAQYTLYKDIAEGVAAGSHKSIQTVSGLLFYLGTHGVYSYNGGTPVLISQNFGEKVFTDGTSGTDGDTYYLSVREGEDSHLLCYETRERIWVHEDHLYAKDFAAIGRTLRMLLDDGSVQAIAAGKDDPWLEWMAQLCPYWDTMDGRKSSDSLTVRMDLPRRSWVKVMIRTDGGPWREVSRFAGSEKDCTFIPLPVARADKTEIKLEGKGPCAIMGIVRRFRVGSPRK